MYRNILIPTDGSELAAEAARKAIALAKALGAKITAVTVTEPFHVITGDVAMVEDTPGEYRRRAEERARAVLGKVERLAMNEGVPCETIHVTEDDPYEGIIEAATQKECDMIAMGSHGRRGLGALLLGSQTQKVLTHTKIPVIVFR